MRKPKLNPKSFFTMEKWLCDYFGIPILLDLRNSSSTKEEYRLKVRALYLHVVAMEYNENE